METWRNWALSLVLALLSGAVAQEDARTATEDLTNRFQEAYNAGNFEEVADLFTEDAWWSDATGEVLEGRATILEDLNEPAEPVLEGTTLEITVAEVVEVSEGSVTRGSYVFRREDGAAAWEGSFLAFDVMVDGEWRIRWLITNTILPPMPAGEQVGGGGEGADDGAGGAPETPAGEDGGEGGDGQEGSGAGM